LQLQVSYYDSTSFASLPTLPPMIVIECVVLDLPKLLTGPWSAKGYLLLRHVVQRQDHRRPDLAWAAEMMETSEPQLRRLLHRDNDSDSPWFWKFVSILEDKGWPMLVLFEIDGTIHYNAVEALPYDMDVEWKRKGKVLTWHSRSRFWKPDA